MWQIGVILQNLLQSYTDSCSEANILSVKEITMFLNRVNQHFASVASMYNLLIKSRQTFRPIAITYFDRACDKD